MLVEEYEAEFTRLSRLFLLWLLPRDLFIQGLRQEIQGSVSAHASQDFVMAYNAAVKLDATTPRSDQGSSSQVRPSGKQKFTQISSGSQQQAVPQRVDRRPFSGDGRAGCSKCGLTHAGSCNAADKTC